MSAPLPNPTFLPSPFPTLATVLELVLDSECVIKFLESIAMTAG